jgi:hypothetical protein
MRPAASSGSVLAYGPGVGPGSVGRGVSVGGSGVSVGGGSGVEVGGGGGDVLVGRGREDPPPPGLGVFVGGGGGVKVGEGIKT